MGKVPRRIGIGVAYFLAFYPYPDAADARLAVVRLAVAVCIVVGETLQLRPTGQLKVMHFLSVIRMDGGEIQSILEYRNG